MQNCEAGEKFCGKGFMFLFFRFRCTKKTENKIMTQEEYHVIFCKFL